MKCSQCNQPVQPDWNICPYCQAQLKKIVNPYAASMVYETQPTETGGDVTGGVIPYKNPKALIAYYLGILSGLPLIGIPLGIAAFVLGVLGLRDRKRNPAVKGSAHAWIGIGCGGVFALFWTAILIVIIFAASR